MFTEISERVDGSGVVMFVYAQRLNADGENTMIGIANVEHGAARALEAKIEIRPAVLWQEVEPLKRLCLEFITKHLA